MIIIIITKITTNYNNYSNNIDNDDTDYDDDDDPFLDFITGIQISSLYLSISLIVDTLSYCLFQPVLHDWYNKGRGMCYPFCGMVHIKQPLLLIGKSSPCGGSGFHLSMSEWSLTTCLTPYNRKIKCVHFFVK